MKSFHPLSKQLAKPPRPPKQKKRHAARLLSGRSRPRPPPSSSTLGPTTTENTTTTQRWFSNFVSNRTQGPFNSLYVVDNDSTTVESDEDGDEIMNQSISKNQSLPHIKEKKKEEVMPRMPPSRPTSTANNNTNSSSFGIYLDDYYTTANTTTTTTTTEKARKKQVEATTPPPLKKKQEEDEEEEKVPLKKNKKRSQNIASESSIDVYVAAPAVTKKRKNPTTLPPSSTSDSVLIEIPPSIDLTGATGVVGRITSGRTREILLDMMGVQCPVQAVPLPTTIAVASLSRDGRLVIGSLFNSIVRNSNTGVSTSTAMHGEGHVSSSNNRTDGKAAPIASSRKRTKTTEEHPKKPGSRPKPKTKLM